MGNSKRVLFLISDTGGGHRSVARALSSVFIEKYGFDCLLPDFFKEGTKPPFQKFPRHYDNITKRRCWFYGLLWYGIYPAPFYNFLNRIVDFFSPSGLNEFYERNYPFDCVISCHALFNHFPLKALRKRYKEIPFFVVVVDLVSLHTGWFTKEADFFFLPTRESEKVFLKKGFRRETLAVYGYPLRRGFEIDLDKKKTKKEMDLLYEKIVLLIGGGEGTEQMEGIAEVFLRRTDYGVIVITGRNEDLRQKLESRYKGEERIKVFGFFEDMAKVFSIADLCVTKAGPATIMEAIAKKVPLILMSYYYGQETGNVRWVEEKGIGFYEKSPKEILRKAKLILETDLGKRMKGEMAKIHLPKAAEKICDKIIQLLNSKFNR